MIYSLFDGPLVIRNTYMYIYMHMCVYIYMYTYMYIYIYIMHIYTCMHTGIQRTPQHRALEPTAIRQIPLRNL